MNGNTCPKCGSRMIVGRVAIEHCVCPRCGYTKTEIMGKAEGPSPLEALIEFAGILGISAIIVAGISLLLNSILRESDRGDKANEQESKYENPRDYPRTYRKYKYRVY